MCRVVEIRDYQNKTHREILRNMNNVLNAFVIFWSKVLIALFAFATGIIVARQFGPNGKGVYDLFLTITSLIVTVGSFGIGTALIYLINKQKKDSVKLVSNSLILGIIWGAVLNVLFYLTFLYFPRLLSGLPLKYIFLAFLVIPFTLLHNYLMPFFLAKFQIIKWAAFSIFYVAFILIGIIFSIFIFNLGMDGVIYATTLSSILTFLLIILAIFREIPFKLGFDKNLFGEKIKIGLRSYLGDIFSLVNFKLSLLFVNILAGIAAVGYYSVTINIASILFFIPFSFQQVLYSAWSSSRDEEINKNTIKIARQSLIVGIISALFLLLIGKYFIIFFYGKEFYPALSPLVWILPGFIFMNFASIFFSNFFAKGKQYITTVILIIVLAVNIFLSLVFISNPKIGVKGASIAISISYFFAAVISVFIFSKNSGYSVWKIIRIRYSDFRNFYLNFKSIFKSKKMLEITPDLNIEKLKVYYEEKAAKTEDGVKSSFMSSSLFKRLFYSARVDKIMKMLDIKKKDKILEIGCGTGYYTKKITEVNNNLIATDISENYVNKAMANNPHKILGYYTCPVEKMPFPDNSFDKILMSEVIEHLINAEDGLKEIKRVLKPGGKLIISTPNKHSYLNLLYHLKITLTNPPFEEEHIKEFSGKELKQLLKKYFVIEKLGYLNYFPILLPGFLLKRIGFNKIDKINKKIESLLNKIPGVRKFGFMIIVRAIKKIKHVDKNWHENKNLLCGKYGYNTQVYFIKPS